MSSKLIATIYFYLISAAALALMVIGVFNIVNFTLNITQYDQYPLRYLSEVCDDSYSFGRPVPAIAPDPSQASLSAEERLKLKQACEARLDQQRKQERLDDLKNAIVFPIIGAFLFLVHFPLARKASK